MGPQVLPDLRGVQGCPVFPDPAGHGIWAAIQHGCRDEGLDSLARFPAGQVLRLGFRV